MKKAFPFEWTEDEKHWHEKRCGCEHPGRPFFCSRLYPLDPDWCSIHGWEMEACSLKTSEPEETP